VEKVTHAGTVRTSRISTLICWYQQLVLLRLCISDIDNWNSGYQQCTYITDMDNSNCRYQYNMNAIIPIVDIDNCYYCKYMVDINNTNCIYQQIAIPKWRTDIRRNDIRQSDIRRNAVKLNDKIRRFDIRRNGIRRSSKCVVTLYFRLWLKVSAAITALPETKC